MSAGLPGWLAAALRDKASTASGRELAASSAEVSARYRQSATSAVTIDSAEAALAYALSRMPATYAAVSAVLDELRARAPDFSPAAMLDAGAGPGTATWAAREVWPELGPGLLLDHNPHLLALAADLAEAADAEEATTRVKADLGRVAPGTGPFDFVVAAYALTELPEAALAPAALSLWARCAGALAIVEPGRPRDYARLMEVRAALIAAGARVVSPCPQEGACPLIGSDWCHFSVRLPRSREHLRMKAGTLGYEDEKFSFLIVARPELAAGRAFARVIKPPRETKAGVELELCTPDGIAHRSVASRDRQSFKAAKRLRWGDAAA
jgi:ribosomal protein RSM22 (predicted rRNA methylase)